MSALADIHLAALLHLMRKVAGIELGKALGDGFHDTGKVAVTKVLCDGDQARTALLDDLGVDGGVVAVTGEAIIFMDENQIDGAFFQIGDQALEFRAVVVGARFRAIGVSLDDDNAALLGVFVDGIVLGFDRGFMLTVR